MTFLELWGERVDPGEIGGVEFSAQHEACPSRVLTIARFAFVLFALPLLWGLALPMILLPAWQSACLLVGGTLIYVAIGYLVRPEPNFDNIGLAGGLIDHPGRYSDDINRELIGTNMLLGPGRFIADSLVDFVLLWQSTPGGSEKDDMSVWDSPQANAANRVEDRPGEGDHQGSDPYGLGRE